MVSDCVWPFKFQISSSVHVTLARPCCVESTCLAAVHPARFLEYPIERTAAKAVAATYVILVRRFPYKTGTAASKYPDNYHNRTSEALPITTAYDGLSQLVQWSTLQVREKMTLVGKESLLVQRLLTATNAQRPGHQTFLPSLIREPKIPSRRHRRLSPPRLSLLHKLKLFPTNHQNTTNVLNHILMMRMSVIPGSNIYVQL